MKFGGPGSLVWNWLTSYFLSVADRYARCPPLTGKKVARLRRHWLEDPRQRKALLIAPAVLDVVGRKPRCREPEEYERTEGRAYQLLRDGPVLDLPGQQARGIMAGSVRVDS